MTRSMVSRDELLRVPFTRMQLDPDNERMHLGPMDWLVSNIRSEGVKEPLWGYKGTDEKGKEWYYVVNGSRRFEALKVIYDRGKGIDIEAPFKTFNPEKVNVEQRIVERLIRNEGMPYSRLEKAASIGKLSAYGWTNQRIAEQLSMSITYVADSLLLHQAPERLKNLIVAGTLSGTLAIDLIKTGEMAVFLAEYGNGVGAGAGSVNEGQGEPPVGGTATTAQLSLNNKITKKKLTGLNSIKEYKRFSKSVDPATMSDHSSRVFIFLKKLLNNELTREEIQEFFR